MRDNVTPFRKRSPPKPKGNGSFNLQSHRGKAVLVQFLTLAAFGLNFVFPAAPISYLVLAVAIAGVAIAAQNRNTAMPWASTHHEHALRTLLIGYITSFLVTLILSMTAQTINEPRLLTVAYWFGVAVLVWAGIRAGVGLVLAIMRRPIWHPRGWLL